MELQCKKVELRGVSNLSTFLPLSPFLTVDKIFHSHPQFLNGGIGQNLRPGQFPFMNLITLIDLKKKEIGIRQPNLHNLL